MFEIELYKIGLNAKDSSLLVIDPPECSSIRKILAEFLFEKFVALINFLNINPW